MFECIRKNVLGDRVKPIEGSVLRVDLAFNLLGAYHSGIYIGNDEIVEVYNDAGEARIRKVSPDVFLERDDPILGSGCYIYVAVANIAGELRPFGGRDIADYARQMVGKSLGSYQLLNNNCHMFSEECISCGGPRSLAWFPKAIENALIKKFGAYQVEWASTGCKCGDVSFEAEGGQGGNGGRQTRSCGDNKAPDSGCRSSGGDDEARLFRRIGEYIKQKCSDARQIMSEESIKLALHYREIGCPELTFEMLLSKIKATYALSRGMSVCVLHRAGIGDVFDVVARSATGELQFSVESPWCRFIVARPDPKLLSLFGGKTMMVLK